MVQADVDALAIYYNWNAMYFLLYCIVGKIPDQAEIITDTPTPNPDPDLTDSKPEQGVFPHEITAKYYRYSSAGLPHVCHAPRL